MVIVAKSVMSPQMIATYGEPVSRLGVVRSPIALPASESPMIATVGPMTTAGISLFIQPTPAALTMIARTTYTRPANTAPRMSPR